MTRVCLKSNEDVLGTIVGEIDGDVWVLWDGGADRMRLRRSVLIELVPEGAEPPSLELRLLTLLDNLRDAFNLQIECTMRDIRRLMKKEERR